MTTSITKPTLAERIADARREVEPHQLRVNTLEAAKSGAIEREDFASAERAQAELPDARQELAIAQGLLDSLLAADAEINRQRDVEAAELQLAQRAAEARAQLEPLQQREAETIAESRRLLNEARQKLAEVKATLEAALNTERAAGDLRQKVYDATALVEGRAAAHAPKPNLVQSSIESDPLLIAVRRPR